MKTKSERREGKRNNQRKMKVDGRSLLEILKIKLKRAREKS